MEVNVVESVLVNNSEIDFERDKNSLLCLFLCPFFLDDAPFWGNSGLLRFSPNPSSHTGAGLSLWLTGISLSAACLSMDGDKV